MLEISARAGEVETVELTAPAATAATGETDEEGGKEEAAEGECNRCVCVSVVFVLPAGVVDASTGDATDCPSPAAALFGGRRMRGGRVVLCCPFPLERTGEGTTPDAVLAGVCAGECVTRVGVVGRSVLSLPLSIPNSGDVALSTPPPPALVCPPPAECPPTLRDLTGDIMADTVDARGGAAAVAGALHGVPAGCPQNIGCCTGCDDAECPLS